MRPAMSSNASTRPTAPLYKKSVWSDSDRQLRQLDDVCRSEGWTTLLSYSVFREVTTQRQFFLYSGSVGRVDVEASFLGKNGNL